MLARVIRNLAIVAALAVAPGVVHAQDSAVRMEIKSVGDSTFTFNSSQIPWVASGQNGMRLKLLQRMSFLPARRVKGRRRAIEDASNVAGGQRHEEALALVRVGEMSGTLDHILETLASERARAEALRNKVTGALQYPAFVLLAAGAVYSWMVRPKDKRPLED